MAKLTPTCQERSSFKNDVTRKDQSSAPKPQMHESQGVRQSASQGRGRGEHTKLGLSCSSRSVSSLSKKSKRGVGLSLLLNSADHTFYRSATMRLCYLSFDRPDLQCPSKELARWMQARSNIVGSEAHARRHSQNHENPWNLETGISWNQTP